MSCRDAWYPIPPRLTKMVRNDHVEFERAVGAFNLWWITSSQPDEEGDISVALSGGGHRAALFAVGALLGLTDAGLNGHTDVIASVSGGSITYGLVAKSGDFKTADRAALEDHLKRGVAIFAHTGLFFPGPLTNRFVGRFFGWSGLR